MTDVKRLVELRVDEAGNQSLEKTTTLEFCVSINKTTCCTASFCVSKCVINALISCTACLTDDLLASNG